MVQESTGNDVIANVQCGQFQISWRMAALPTIRENQSLAELKSKNGELFKNGRDDDDDVDDDNIPFSSVVSQRALQFTVRFLKGFGSGLGVFSGIKVVTALMRNPFRERQGAIQKSLFIWKRCSVEITKVKMCLWNTMPPPGSSGVTGQGEGHKVVSFDVLCKCKRSANIVPCIDQSYRQGLKV